jgi:nucleotide-binding universal stress UspA family protein
LIQIRHILLPTDFSPPSRNAGRYASSFAREYRAKVCLLHVVDRPGLAVSLPESGYAQSARLAEIEKEVSEGLLGALPDAGGDLEVDRLIRHGKAYEEILAAAREREVDLIVMGTHGRSGLSHILLGSTAERVVRSAPCPVLTVRHPEHEFVMP